jgi:predicted TIM-barrel fold metal-dependent hydrolase
VHLWDQRERETARSDVRGIVWSDAGAEDAAMPNVATRLDAIGTVFGAWTAEEVRPWLLAVVATFGRDRCLLGSDLPIERLRSGFEALYRADDEIFAEHSRRDREMLLRATVERWYGTG